MAISIIVYHTFMYPIFMKCESVFVSRELFFSVAVLRSINFHYNIFVVCEFSRFSLHFRIDDQILCVCVSVCIYMCI